MIRNRQSSAKDYQTVSSASGLGSGSRRDTQTTSNTARLTTSSHSSPSSSHSSPGSDRRRRNEDHGYTDTGIHDFAPARSNNAPQADGQDPHPQTQSRSGDGGEQKGGWWAQAKERYGSVELENKASVARDHLALERTYLAWLRTSLSFASIGIAVTQLFRLNTTISSDMPDLHSLRHVGKPLGATFIAIALVVLCIGFHRYFESQHYVIRGKFPASRGSILFVTFMAGALIICSLVVILSVAPRAFER